MSEGVVRQRRQVDDRVESFQVGGGHVPQVDSQAGRVGGGGAEHAVGEPADVEAGDLVARCLQHRGHDGAEVALVAGEQDLHAGTPIFTVVVGTTKASAYRWLHWMPRSLMSAVNASASNQGCPSAWLG